jgi:hypothetical protein
MRKSISNHNSAAELHKVVLLLLHHPNQQQMRYCFSRASRSLAVLRFVE